jgi:hypothetical protein
MRISTEHSLTKLQDSIFAQPQAAPRVDTGERDFMTKLQDSCFAQPQAARQGKAQGRAL